MPRFRLCEAFVATRLDFFGAAQTRLRHKHEKTDPFTSDTHTQLRITHCHRYSFWRKLLHNPRHELRMSQLPRARPLSLSFVPRVLALAGYEVPTRIVCFVSLLRLLPCRRKLVHALAELPPPRIIIHQNIITFFITSLAEDIVHFSCGCVFLEMMTV